MVVGKMQRLIFRFLIPAAILTLLLWWGIPRMSPATQLQRAEADLFHALERAKRSLLQKRLADSYNDQWGQDRATAVNNAMDLSRQFLSIKINLEIEPARIEGTRATSRIRIRMDGRGTGAASEIIRRVNQIDAPFTLEWTRDPWKPWSWRVISVANPALPHLK